MSAQYRIDVKHRDTGNLDFAYVFSADAKSMKPADIRVANKKAADKGLAKLAKQGKTDLVVLAVHCVG